VTTRLMCDFCASNPPTCYFPCTPFTMSTERPAFTFNSGDRFYACPGCRRLVEARDWSGLGARCGSYDIIQSVPNRGVRMLWAGFAQHRQGPAVEFPAGTNPEAGR
jgi:hypothetical protein